MRNMDEEIAKRLAEAAASGELSRAEGYGKPFAETDGWNETPEALRMPFRFSRMPGWCRAKSRCSGSARNSPRD